MGLHRRYERLLAGADPQLMAASASEATRISKELSHLFRDLMKVVHATEGASFSVNLLASDQAQALIGAHAAALDSSFRKVEMSEAMRRRLHRSDYIFSGMKVFHELNEAFPALLGSNGDLKPFEQFYKEVSAIHDRYNRHYLRAEYNFVHASAQMAARWEEFAADGDDYNLQYRTAGDNRVREEHRALDGVTLPFSDPFWEEFLPPNGWNCRCSVVQVRKSKYPVTDAADARRRGEQALQRDTRGMFRFNPGTQQKTVPDYNPYTISACRSCPVANGKSKLAKTDIPQNELCEACQISHFIAESHDENYQKYLALKDSHNYYNVAYDEKSGGVKAIHKGHIIHSSEKEERFFDERLTSTELELICQDILFHKGYSCILLDEQQQDSRGKQLPQLDCEINGMLIDIRAITTHGKNTIRNSLKSKKKQLKNFNKKTGSDSHSVLLYFHDSNMFDESQIMPELGKTLNSIMCVFRDGKIIQYKKS